MDIKYYCPFWGSKHLSLEKFIDEVKIEGYDGIEYAIHRQPSERELEELWNIADKENLDVIIQHYDTIESDFEKHYDVYSVWYERLEGYPCVKVNSQTGKDYFSIEQNLKLIEVGKEFETKSGIEVLHETHRGKFGFAAHIMKEYLLLSDDLKITLDISHWVNVAESYLQDQKESVDLAISRTEHIHARVGFPEGPQVIDPRAPECKEALDHHLKWWDKIVHQKRKKDSKLLTITPEFGPYPYLAHLPYTFQPITDQWNTNVFIKNLLQNRFGS